MTLEESYRHSVEVSRRRAKNFYYSFLLLPRAKRRAICAIYAFMRQCDDLSDDDGDVARKRAALEDWRRQLDAANADAHPVWPAFFDTVARYRIPTRYFHEMIDGVESDLEPRRILTFDDLYRYCYLVASVVGLVITHIFEFEDPQALVLAEKCGIAFQLTNIIRDVKEDALMGRVYLPEKEYQGPAHEASFPLTRELSDLGERAFRYYREARPLVGLVHKDSRRALWALMEIYRQLLEKIARSQYDVFAGRVSLTTKEKAKIVACAWLGLTRS